MIRLAVAGASGRTGRCAVELASRDDRFEVVAALTKPGCPTSGSTVRVGESSVSIIETLDTACDVLVDFAVAEGTMAWLDVCIERGIALVSGATGHSDEQLARLRQASGRIPILQAANFSVGIQAILRAVGPIAAKLGEAYDIEIVEAHHRHKVDAPSGTALELADRVAAATGATREDFVFGREGYVGERPTGQIGVHAVRMGDFVGWHEVHFSGPGEVLTIRHAAHSRDTFAAGALRAAAWIMDKPPGRYTMRDVMG